MKTLCITTLIRIPNKDLDIGLQRLASDNDVLNLAKYVGKHKVIEVHMELWLSSLDIFEQSSKKSKVTFVGLDDDVPKQSKNIEFGEDVNNTQTFLPRFDMSDDFDPFFFLS